MSELQSNFNPGTGNFEMLITISPQDLQALNPKTLERLEKVGALKMPASEKLKILIEIFQLMEKP